jgi:hypothetical protein
MTTGYAFAISPRIAPESLQEFFALERKRAQEAAARCTRDPWRRAQTNAHEHTGSARQSGIPAQCFTAYAASPATNCLVTVIGDQRHVRARLG